MNNYSWIQQKLHQLALSKSFMREVTFDIESSIISTNQFEDKHVFVSGLARSGTTILLNALYLSGEFSSLSYRDMPFVLAPNLWSKLSFTKQENKSVERAHGDGINVSIDSPEAFEEVFWMTFADDKQSTREKFKTYVDLINFKYQKKRYISKNNQNIKRLDLISCIFPNSKILIPFRNPVQHAHSLLSQHKRFIENSKKDSFVSDYMKWIGHTEFGSNYSPIHNNNLHFREHLDINHWIEQWFLTYQKCFLDLKDNKNIYFICYEELCLSKAYWQDILRILEINDAYNFEFKESQKNIDFDIDGVLSGKAFSLYDQLIEFRLFKEER